MDDRFDGGEYWKNRHSDVRFRGTLSSVGSKSYSTRANYFSYRIVLEQYDKILTKLALEKNTRFLDAGAGIGIFSQFLYERGFDVTAFDVSAVALDQISNPNIRKAVGTLTRLDFDGGSFDVVHCFDVLYHIIDDEDWKAALSWLCACSRKHLILHERFMSFPQLVSSRHVKQRTRRETFEILAEHGFFEILSIPTHLVAMRLPTYRVSRFAPEFFYFVDRYGLNFIEETRFRFLGSHHIKVFERKTT
jgi:2-polyprenyl-3-methyl-5-hydroxy-6-metoxy-1,4-benzoquinol methylase